MKKTLCAFLSATLLASSAVTALAVETTDSANTAPVLTEGTYAPNQVVVMFKDSAIDTDSVPKKGDLEPVGAAFGDGMEASSSESEALGAADEEVNVLSKSLGDDFVLEDTLIFDESQTNSKSGGSVGASANASSDGLTVALVSSDKYDTAALIEKLSKNKSIEKIEPNYYLTEQSVDYSLDDPLNWYNYQANSPCDNNTGGDSVSSRGLDPEACISTNAANAWNKLTGDEEEIVVAVIDSGVNTYHEDLMDVLWTNPGNIGLEGEHGFNFSDKASDVTDLLGHGTHCSGVIGAQANNGVGIAGVGSAANVKIMMCATSSAIEFGDGNRLSYDTLGAFNYILKAKQRGVNVVATSNSWGSPGNSEILDDIITRLGEEGVISFFAAGNENNNIDNQSYFPAGGNSPYKVTVGAAGINGERACFSNYGRAKVDLFAPGVDILSTVGYANYFPNIDPAETRSENTAYYGLFDGNTVIENGCATPSVTDCDGTVKQFGASVFRIQGKNDGPYATDATCTLSLDTEHTFTKSDSPASLKVTLSNFDSNAKYYLYFPFECDPYTTAENTDFSVYLMRDSELKGVGATVSAGEVIVEQDGTCSMFNGGFAGVLINKTHFDMATHVNSHSDRKEMIIGADELNGRKTGIGFCIMPFSENETADKTITFYIDSIAVSKCGADIFNDESYQVMSGTSMATPAAAGAYAALAAVYPKQEGQSGSEYALQNRARLLSCVTKTQALSDYCATGGYLDLSKIDLDSPSFTRVECDVENDSIIISGTNLNKKEYTLSYQRRAVEGAEPVALPSNGMTVEFAEDGSSVTIHNAKALFGTYTEFTLRDGGDIVAKICDFIVKGQPKLEQVLNEPYPQTINDQYFILPNRHLITDTEGEKLYGFDITSGTLSRFDGVQFNDVKGTEIQEATLQYLKTQGYSDFDIRNNITVNQETAYSLITMDNKVFLFVNAEYTSSAEGGYNEYYRFLAYMDYTAQKPAWSFRELSDYREQFGLAYYSSPLSFAMNGKIYLIDEITGEDPEGRTPIMISYDVGTEEWSLEQAPPVVLTEPQTGVRDGRFYMTMGSYFTDENGITYRCLDTAIHCFDGEGWTRLGEIPYLGGNTKAAPQELYAQTKGCFAPVKDGLLFFDCPVDGGGNLFLYNTGTNEMEPLYYSDYGYKPDNLTLYSAVETKDGIYYIEKTNDGKMEMFNMYLLSADSGAYTPGYSDIILGDADGDGKVSIKDVTAVQRHIAEYEDVANIKAADVNRDGVITIDDATALQMYLAEYDLPYPVGEILIH